MTPTLLLLRGLPGSGKTTLAALLDPHYIEADHYFIRPDGYVFDPSMLPDAHRWAQARARQRLAAGDPLVIVSNTFSRQWEMDPYRQIAMDTGAQITIAEVQSGLDDEALAARNAHTVPAVAITKMRARWER